MSDRQHELYQQVILDHNKRPRNYGELTDPSHSAEGFNPLCGDHLWVHLKVDDAGLIQEVMFKGEGCAISKASASMMTTVLKGQKIEDAETIISEFKSMVKGELNPDEKENSLGRLKIFSGIWRYPSRVKCAILAWHAVSGALNDESSVTTE